MVELYEVLAATPGVFGARFSGAGFRGCCIALVDGARAADITASVRENYARRHPELAAGAPAFVCHSGDGAQVGRREGPR
jgi:galacturonokinase